MAMSGYWWQKLLIANIFLVLFNMIPAFPMDGGRVLRALLAIRLGEVKATEIAAAIGQALAFVFAAIGLFVPRMFMLLFVAFFVFIGANQEAAMYRSKALVAGLLVRAAMITDFRRLSVGANLRAATDLLLETSQSDFPVMNGEEVVGVLSRQALLRGLAKEGPEGYVAGVMERDYLSAGPDDSLEEIAAEMQGGQRSCTLVMQEEQLLGLVTMENLAELLVVRQLLQDSSTRRETGMGR
jgi:CBS domain-containing protein